MRGRNWGRASPWGTQLGSRGSLRMSRAHWCGEGFGAPAVGGWGGGLVGWVKFEGCSINCTDIWLIGLAFFSVLVVCIWVLWVVECTAFICLCGQLGPFRGLLYWCIGWVVVFWLTGLWLQCLSNFARTCCWRIIISSWRFSACGLRGVWGIASALGKFVLSGKSSVLALVVYFLYPSI